MDEKEKLEPVLTHRVAPPPSKKCIKPFLLKPSELTGLANFEVIAQNPLAIPAPESTSSLPQQVATTTSSARTKPEKSPAKQENQNAESSQFTANASSAPK